MKYTEMCGERVSALGYGTMRFPCLPTGAIDEEKTKGLIDLAVKAGVNYFDTAHPYHGGMSERVIGKLLSAYPRDSYFLADKYPGHQILEAYDPAATFEEQLQKCGVDYFDFYLLHNVCENSIEVYESERWGIIPYFVEQKRLGRIKHLGFSTHARPETLKAFLDRHGNEMEFCQIQMNYLDYTLQDAKQKYELLTERGIPIVVMEPVRGGRLSRLDEAMERELFGRRPTESISSWSFRFLQAFPNIKVVLSGMTTIEQLTDNINTFSGGVPLSEEEKELLLFFAEKMKGAVPCTACRYCCEGCPMGLDIPTLVHAYNDAHFDAVGFTVGMQIDALPEDKKPSACIGCGACTKACPQGIDIPSVLRGLVEILPKLPNWAAICKKRAEEAAKNAAKEETK